MIYDHQEVDEETRPVTTRVGGTRKYVRRKETTKKGLQVNSNVVFKTPKPQKSTHTKFTGYCSACGLPGHYKTTCQGRKLKLKMYANNQSNVPGSAGKKRTGKASRFLQFDSLSKGQSFLPVQQRVNNILNTFDVKFYLKSTLVENMISGITHQTSVFGINGFRIDSIKLDEWLNSSNAKESQLYWEEFREMIGACGFEKVDLKSDGRSSNILKSSIFRQNTILQYEWSPVRCWLKVYRYASKSKVTEDTYFQNKNKNVSKCPQILAHVYEQVRQRMIEKEILTKRNWFNYDGNHNDHNTALLVKLLDTSCESVFFPFAKFEYDKEILPRLFTVFKDDGDYETSHANMKVTRQFQSHLPMYFEWIMKNAFSISLL